MREPHLEIAEGQIELKASDSLGVSSDFACPGCGSSVDLSTLHGGCTCTKCGAELFLEKTLAQGAIIDSAYEVIELLGDGSWGKVYRARQMSLNRDVAVKVLHRRLASDERKVMRFQAEVLALRNLHHAGIAQVYDSGITEQGQPYVVQEFIEGVNLAHWRATNNSPSAGDFKKLFVSLLQSIAAAHKQGVIHRDIKPENIIVGNDGSAVLLDFGVAKFTHCYQSELTATGELIGTPLYMSPEQCSGDLLDARSDLYSLACVMYFVVAGQPPFDARSSFECMMKHVEELPSGCGASPPYEILIQKAMAKAPEDRYQSADEIAQALQAVTDDVLLYHRDGSASVPAAAGVPDNRRNNGSAALSKHPAGARGERFGVRFGHVFPVLFILVACFLLGYRCHSRKEPAHSLSSSSTVGATREATKVPRAVSTVVVDRAVETEPSLDEIMHPPVESFGRVQLQKRINGIRQGATWLSAAGRSKLADALVDEMRTFTASRGGKEYTPTGSKDVENHAVMLWQGRQPDSFAPQHVNDVEISYTSSPVRLILQSNREHGTCNLIVRKGVRLTEIVLCGWYEAQLQGAPPGVRVIRQRTSQAFNMPLFGMNSGRIDALNKGDHYDLHTSYMEFQKEMLEHTTGSAIATCSNSRDGRCVVGSSNSDWVDQHLAARMTDLYNRSQSEEKQAASKVAENMRFTALDLKEYEGAFLSPFTGLGPVKLARVVKVDSPINSELVFFPPQGKTFINGRYKSFAELNTLSGGSTPVKLPEYAVGLKLPVYTGENTIQMYSDEGVVLFDPTTGKWQSRKDQPMYGSAVAVCNAEQNCYYALSSGPTSIATVLAKLDFNGRILSKVILDEPFSTPSDGTVQLRYCDGYVVAVIQCLNGLIKKQVILIDPSSGHIALRTLKA